MLKINQKTFLNIQEAVQWLLDNNALPFQCTANYAANTEIGFGTIVNPTMAKVRIGSIVFFTDSKASTVIGVSSTGFTVSDQYIDLADDVRYISSVEIIANGLLSVTFSDGSIHTAGLIKMCTSFEINSSQHLIAYFNDNTQVDLGAIFQGNVNISGDLTVSGDMVANGNILGDSVNTKALDDLEGQGYIEVLKPLRLDELNSSGSEISARKPIVEDMTGYTLVKPTTDAYREIDNIYASVCKNGNKITFVMFGSFKRIDPSLTPSQALINYDFYIPTSVGEKLYPYQIGAGYYLDQRSINGKQKSNYATIPLNLDVTKVNNGCIKFGTNCFGGDIPDNEVVYFRIEQTFLLSDNLAA